MSQSVLTREQFVQQEIAMGVEAQGIPGVDFSAAAGTFDPDVVEAIQKRAEWNAQAAERAGVTWRQEQEPEDDPKWPTDRMVLWSVPNSMRYSAYRILEDGTMQYSWEEAEHGWSAMTSVHPAMQELAKRLVAEHQAKQQVAKSVDEAWKLAHPSRYEYEEDDRGYEIAREEFKAGYEHGYRAGVAAYAPNQPWDGERGVEVKGRHGVELLGIEIHEEVGDRMEEFGSRLDQHKASIAQLAEEVTRLREMSRLDRANQKTAEEDLNEKVETIGANLQGLMDSIGKAHGRINELFTEKARIDQRVDRANQRLDKLEGPVLQGVQNVTLGLGNKIDNLNLAVASLIGRVCKLERGEAAKGEEGPE